MNGYWGMPHWDDPRLFDPKYFAVNWADESDEEDDIFYESFDFESWNVQVPQSTGEPPNAPKKMIRKRGKRKNAIRKLDLFL